jgi:hypothetical protein
MRDCRSLGFMSLSSTGASGARYPLAGYGTFTWSWRFS